MGRRDANPLAGCAIQGLGADAGQHPVTLIADNAAGQLMRTGRWTSCCRRGRVAANGDVANKVGSYKLAVVAKENGIPCFCVFFPTSTMDMSYAERRRHPDRGAGCARRGSP